jgi:hypothetical protein
MATSQGGSPSPKRKNVGPKFVKSGVGTGVAVRPARDRGETRVGPTHCESTRKNFPGSYGGSGY